MNIKDRCRNFNYNKVKRRDNFLCQKCGSKERLEVHHINPLYLGGDNSIDNLITLCSICHSHAPDNYDEFEIYLSIPLRPHFKLVEVMLIDFCLHLGESDDIISSRIKVLEFLNKYVKILNPNLEKCRSNLLWKSYISDIKNGVSKYV